MRLYFVRLLFGSVKKIEKYRGKPVPQHGQLCEDSSPCGHVTLPDLLNCV
jgi:hypothetical protein